jgi:hypothetical protein
MGFNTVAVLYNDFNFANATPELGNRIQDAIRGWSWRDRDSMATHFGCGIVVSQAHADHTQIVAVGQNTGQPIQDCNDLDYIALAAMAECLIRHGWTARAPARKRKVRSA